MLKSNLRLSSRSRHSNSTSENKVNSRYLLHPTRVKRTMKITYGFKVLNIPTMPVKSGGISAMNMSADGSYSLLRRERHLSSTWKSFWSRRSNSKRGKSLTFSLFKTKCRSAWLEASSLNAKKGRRRSDMGMVPWWSSLNYLVLIFS